MTSATDQDSTDVPEEVAEGPAAPSDAALSEHPPRSERKRCPKRRRRRRIVGWSCGSVLMVIAGLALAAYLLIGREVTAPQWVQARLEARLSQMVPEGSVRFGSVSVEVSNRLKPRVLMLDVEVLDVNDRPILALGELETGLAARPLLEGKMRLGKLRMSGAEVNMRRRADGSFDVAFGASLPEVEQAATPAEMIANLDALLTSLELEHLREITADALILRFEDARVGRAWTVDGGRVSLIRDGEDLRIRGDMALLGGHQFVTTVETNFESRIGETTAQFGMSFEDMVGPDIAVQSAAVAWLEAVQAPISGALRGSITDDGGLGPISGTLQIGEGVIQPTAATKPVPFRSARSYFTYNPLAQDLVFDELSVDSNWIALRAEGKAILEGVEAGVPEAFLGQFTLSDLTAKPDNLLTQPMSVEAADMSFRLGLDPFELHMGELTLRAEGQTAVLNGKARATSDGWQVSAGAQVAELDPAALLRLWPEDLKPKSRAWVEKNIYQATLTNGRLAFRKTSGQPHDLLASFEFSDAKVRYSRHLPPVEQAMGHGVLEGKRFTVAGDAGVVPAPEGGWIDVTGTTFTIDDITVKPANGEVNLKARANATATLSFLNLHPLSVLDKAGRGLDMATGLVRAEGQLRMPLKKRLPPEKVRYDIDAVLENVVSTTLVPKKTLRAEQFQLNVNNERLVILGPGTVDGVPFDAVYEGGLTKETRGRAEVYGTVEVSAEALDALKIALPKGSVRGRGLADMVIQLEKGQPPRFALSSELRGIGLSVPPLSWSMGQDTLGQFAISGQLTEPPVIDALSLEAPGMSAAGTLSLKSDGTLDRVQLSRVKAGAWLDAPATLIGRGKGKPPLVQVQGGTVDLRRRPASAGTGSGQGGVTPMEVQLDTLRITDTIRLTDLQGRFSAARGMSGSFTGRVNGVASIAGDMAAAGSRSAIEIRSADAGAVFAAAGILKQARGGDMVLRLVPAEAKGNYDGELIVSDTRVTDVPALAGLLHAVSIVGLLEQLSGPGIFFSEVEAKFRLTPDSLILRKSSAIGASMGISMDGYFDLKNKAMDFQGVLSPLYALNGIGAIFTRRGEGLVGFNYLLKGTSDVPKVQVNPLSLFTPGMFREIFRRPPPKVTQ